MIFYGVLVGSNHVGSLLVREYVLSDPTVADGTANTMAFATLVFGELTRAFAVRSETRSIFSIGVFSNSAMNKSLSSQLSFAVGGLVHSILARNFQSSKFDRN